MCWMAIHSGESAVREALRACSDHEDTSGGHSWGYAVATADGSLYLSHGLGDIPPATPDVEADEVVAALGHTRKATRGDITLANAHPFPVADLEGETIAALAHNGTWYQAPDGDRCDSYYIARLLESMYRADPERGFADLVRKVGDITGETITVLHRDGRAFAYAGRFGITEGDGWVQSSGGTTIRAGEVSEI